MPYELKKVKGGWKVQTKTGAKKVHSKKPLSHSKAVAQLRAMYANLPKGEK